MGVTEERGIFISFRKICASEIFFLIFFQQIEIVGIVVVLPVVTEHCVRPGWLDRADSKGTCQFSIFMKSTYAKATFEFFFNGIREIYSEGSHPRRLECAQMRRWKSGAVKANFVWPTFVLNSDAVESTKK